MYSQSWENARFSGKLLALYLLQFSLLIPFARFVEPKIFVAFFSGVITILILLKNRSFKINSRIFPFYFTIVFIFLFKWLIGQADDKAFFNLIIYVSPVLFLFLYHFSYSACIESLCSLSKIVFLLLFWIPFSPLFSASYMRFGYGMTPVVLLAYIDFFKFNSNNKKILKIANILIMFIGGLEALLYGARGCTFTLFLFILLDSLIVKKVNVIRSIILLCISVISYLNLEFIFDVLESIVNKFGVFSYSLFKFKTQLLYGFEKAASGRINLYSNAVEKINANPLFGGNISSEEVYTHNLFLQIGGDFGVFAILAMVLFIFYVLLLLKSKKVIKNEKMLLLIFFAISIGRLMFSSTIWERPEFWILTFYVISMSFNKRINTND